MINRSIFNSFNCLKWQRTFRHLVKSPSPQASHVAYFFGATMYPLASLIPVRSWEDSREYKGAIRLVRTPDNMHFISVFWIIVSRPNRIVNFIIIPPRVDVSSVCSTCTITGTGLPLVCLLSQNQKKSRHDFPLLWIIVYLHLPLRIPLPSFGLLSNSVLEIGSINRLTMILEPIDLYSKSIAISDWTWFTF